ncbi:hypothetical protein P3S67_014528 [Capsicum chacoense]
MELIAFKVGITLAIQHNLLPIEINIDSLKTLRMLTNGHEQYDGIINLCRSKLREAGCPVVHHCFREQNQVADSLAKYGASSNYFEEAHLLPVPPVCAQQVLGEDMRGTFFEIFVNPNAQSSVERNYDSFVINPG